MMAHPAAGLYTGRIMKLDRRNLLAGLFSSALLEAGDDSQAAAGGAPESLYIPKAHIVEDRKFLHDFMDEYSFVDLITATPTLRITHIPAFIDRSRGPYGTVYGHISRQNVQSKAFDGRQPAVIVFRGPHGYISPSWYSNPQSVPTWNFGVVHAGGKLKPVSDLKDLHELLAKLIDKNEDYKKSKYNFRALPDSYKNGMMGGIIGFEMEVERLEGKFKMGHERSETDRQVVLDHLKTAKPERTFAEFTADFYHQHPPSKPKA